MFIETTLNVLSDVLSPLFYSISYWGYTIMIWKRKTSTNDERLTINFLWGESQLFKETFTRFWCKCENHKNVEITQFSQKIPQLPINSSIDDKKPNYLEESKTHRIISILLKQNACYGQSVVDTDLLYTGNRVETQWQNKLKNWIISLLSVEHTLGLYTLCVIWNIILYSQNVLHTFV